MSPLFILAILLGGVYGFQRGWKREIVSLVFVLLAAFLVHVDTSNFVGTFLSHIPGAVTALLGGTPSQAPAPVISGWIPSLFIFAALIVVGYLVGNRLFKDKPDPPARIFGIIPGILSGAFVLWYLQQFLQTATGTSTIPFDFAAASPANYVPVIFVLAILVLVVAIIVLRTKKPASGGGGGGAPKK